jgi:hypothetical protein
MEAITQNGPVVERRPKELFTCDKDELIEAVERFLDRYASA